jgi:hypothetical protein
LEQEDFQLPGEIHLTIGHGNPYQISLGLFSLSLSLSLSLILLMYLPDDVLHIASQELNEVLRYIDRPVKFMMGKDFLLQ